MKNKIKIILRCIIGVIIFAGYITIFTQKIIKVEDVVLVQKFEEDTTVYTGQSNFEYIEILVKKDDEVIDVVYNLPKVTLNYEVRLGKEAGGKYPVIIKQDKQTVFDGYYKEIGTEGLLKWREFYNIDGTVISGSLIRVSSSSGGSLLEREDYKPEITDIVKLTQDDRAKMRGKVEYLIYIFMLLLLLAIDIKYPKFFFLKERLFCKDAEPNEYYYACQMLFRFAIAPAVILICALWAIK